MPTRMLESTPSPEAGKLLRAERLRARLSTRAVQKFSQQIAQEKDNNQDYYISHGWLTDVENGKFTPSIYKLYSLSLIYKCNYLKVLGFFGINILDAAKEQRLVSLPHTHLIGSSLELPGQTIVLPVELRKNVELARTNLVSRMFETWGEIPVGLLQQLDLRNCLCGYIGLEDYTLFPLIRPGHSSRSTSTRTRSSQALGRTNSTAPSISSNSAMVTPAVGVNSTGINLSWFRVHSRGDKSDIFDTQPKRTSSAE